MGGEGRGGREGAAREGWTEGGRYSFIVLVWLYRILSGIEYIFKWCMSMVQLTNKYFGIHIVFACKILC